ncbi:hypothetical protein [Geoalkalibacter subterraneus]|jgi:hypothetical protein|nr:hypothetical protein [Geoalkalibacter subterraneus]
MAFSSVTVVTNSLLLKRRAADLQERDHVGTETYDRSDRSR